MMRILNKNDYNEEGRIVRLRSLEEARKKIIFDARNRSIGLDIKTLDRQAQDIHARRAYDRKLKLKGDEQLKLLQNIMYEYKLKEERLAHKKMTELHKYWTCHQNFKNRREYDLNDFSKTQPARTPENEMCLGLSSMQKFAGEEDDKALLVKQQRQLRAWLDQQAEERTNALELLKEKDEEYEKYRLKRAECVSDMFSCDNIIARAKAMDCHRINQELAKEKKFECALKKRLEFEDDLAEISNMLSSDILTQNPKVGKRGLSPKELKKFREDERRIYMMSRKCAQERLLWDVQFGQYVLNMTHTLKWQDMQEERTIAKLAAERNQEMARLAEEQRKYRAEKDKEFRRNQITAEFYNQFNKNSR